MDIKKLININFLILKPTIMKKSLPFTLIIFLNLILFFSACNQGEKSEPAVTTDSSGIQATAPSYGGFESQVAWGKHIVIISGCNDCHTPKKMGPHGPENNMDMELAGHPSQLPPPEINRKEIESKGLAVISSTFTSFAGPWGISFASNITSDSTTGIGNWTFEQFKNVFKTGKYNGAPKGRDLLPPMPWPNIGSMTNEELQAVFAYLQSTKPIHNIVPQPIPPVSVMKK